jgi:hypothetical protein
MAEVIFRNACRCSGIAVWGLIGGGAANFSHLRQIFSVFFRKIHQAGATLGSGAAKTVFKLLY